MWSVKIWPKPSSPSLGCFLGVAVLLTRIGSMAIALSPLEDDRLAVQPEDLAVHLGDLAQRDVVLHRVHQYRHHVAALATGLRQLLEPWRHPGGVPRRRPRPPPPPPRAPSPRPPRPPCSRSIPSSILR